MSNEDDQIILKETLQFTFYMKYYMYPKPSYTWIWSAAVTAIVTRGIVTVNGEDDTEQKYNLTETSILNTICRNPNYDDMSLYVLNQFTKLIFFVYFSFHLLFIPTQTSFDHKTHYH